VRVDVGRDAQKDLLLLSHLTGDVVEQHDLAQVVDDDAPDTRRKGLA
jgi:hypothetical protein